METLPCLWKNTFAVHISIVRSPQTDSESKQNGLKQGRKSCCSVWHFERKEKNIPVNSYSQTLSPLQPTCSLGLFFWETFLFLF